MNEHDELGDLFPPDRPVSPERRQEMKERLMVQVREAEQTGRRRYRAIAGGVAAAVLVAAGLAVLLTRDGSDSGPDADKRVDVAGDDEGEDPGGGDGNEPSDGPLPAETYQQVEDLVGGRPSLSAEWVACVTTVTRPVDPESSGTENAGTGPLAEPLTREALIDACRYGTNWTDGADASWLPGEPATCIREGGYGPDDNPRDDSFPLPVVAFDEMTCAEAGASGATVREMTDDDLAELNRMRDMEVDLLSDARPCPTAEQAEEWTHDKLDELGLDDAEVVVDDPLSAGSPGAACGWRPRLFWSVVDTAPEPAYGLVVSVTPLSPVPEDGAQEVDGAAG